MPAFPWLDRPISQRDINAIQDKMKALRALGHPYTDEEIAQAPSMLEGKTEMEALVAYLQGLGRALSNFQ